jgi:hypothetical protein
MPRTYYFKPEGPHSRGRWINTPAKSEDAEDRELLEQLSLTSDLHPEDATNSNVGSTALTSTSMVDTPTMMGFGTINATGVALGNKSQIVVANALNEVIIGSLGDDQSNILIVGTLNFNGQFPGAVDYYSTVTTTSATPFAALALAPTLAAPATNTSITFDTNNVFSLEPGVYEISWRANMPPQTTALLMGFGVIGGHVTCGSASITGNGTVDNSHMIGASIAGIPNMTIGTSPIFNVGSRNLITSVAPGCNIVFCATSASGSLSALSATVFPGITAGVTAEVFIRTVPI